MYRRLEDPKEEAACLEWVRDFYRALFAATGGVPVPNEQADGVKINHPDADLADPVWNTSVCPGTHYITKDNYPRCKR